MGFAAKPFDSSSIMEFSPEVASIIKEIEAFMKRTLPTLEIGSDEYFACLSLREAARALTEGNYGIGAQAVLANEQELRVFRGRNGIVSGSSLLRECVGRAADEISPLVGHAEAIALFRSRLAVPDAIIKRSETAATMRFPIGVSIFGTVEACPMCTCIITNDRRVIRSVSTVADDFSASSISAPNSQPLVWRQIQEARGLNFERLKTQNRELAQLSTAVFSQTRAAIDAFLEQKSRAV